MSKSSLCIRSIVVRSSKVPLHKLFLLSPDLADVFLRPLYVVLACLVLFVVPLGEALVLEVGQVLGDVATAVGLGEHAADAEAYKFKSTS